MSLRFLPNLLCVLRILLVYPVAHGILQGRYPQVHGTVRRSRPSPTRSTGSSPSVSAGTPNSARCSIPLADKLLLVTVFICLSIAGLAPWWLAALVLLRDLVILFGALTFKWLFGPLRGAPTVASKLNTLTQIVFCLGAVAAAGFGVPGAAVVTTLGAVVLVTTAVSGIDYVLIYTRRAAVVSRERAATAG